MQEGELKQALVRIKENDFNLAEDETMTYEMYAKSMLQYIGSSDAMLRDELIYEIFDQWIETNRFTSEQLNNYMSICLDHDHLRYHEGDIDQPTVFTRTFSALIIASILHKNHEDHFIKEEQLHQVKKEFIEYYRSEKDLRGYVSDGGWAHSVAHGSDVIFELSQCDNFSKEDLMDFLDVLRSKVCQGTYVYIDREPERICRTVRTILNRNLLSRDEVEEWLTHFQIEPTRFDDTQSWHRMINIQNFYKTLYFALKGQGSTYYIPIIEDLITVL